MNNNSESGVELKLSIASIHDDSVDLEAVDRLHAAFGEKKVSKLFWHQATPNMCATIFYQISVAGAVAALSRSGTDYAASYSFAAPFHIVHVAAGMFISGGTSNTLSKLFGSKELKQARKAATQSIYLAIVLSCAMIGCIYPFIDKILKFLGTPQILMGPSRLYAQIMICGGIITNITMWSNAVLRAQGLAHYVLISAVIRGSFTLILGCCFILIKGWVMSGFCAAILSGDFAALVVNLSFIYFSKKSVVKPKLSGLSKIFLQVIKNGTAELAAGLSNLIMVSLINLGIISLESDSGVSGNELISLSIIMIASRVNTASITQTLSQIMIIMSLNTTLPMANYNREARNWDRLRRINVYSLIATLLTMGILSLILIAFSPLIPRIYFTNKESRSIMEHTLQLNCAGWAFASITTNSMEIIQSFGLNAFASRWSFIVRTGVSIGVYVYVFKKCANMWDFIKAFPINIAISSGLSLIFLFLVRNFFVLTKKGVNSMEADEDRRLGQIKKLDHVTLKMLVLGPIFLLLNRNR